MPRIKPLVRPTRDSLQDQCQLLLSGGLFVHENTDGNGQGLGPTLPAISRISD